MEGDVLLGRKVVFEDARAGMAFIKSVFGDAPPFAKTRPLKFVRGKGLTHAGKPKRCFQCGKGGHDRISHHGK